MRYVVTLRAGAAEHVGKQNAKPRDRRENRKANATRGKHYESTIYDYVDRFRRSVAVDWSDQEVGTEAEAYLLN